MKILDVNILIILSDTGSEYHTRVRAFINRAYDESDVIGLPWTTILGYLRIITRQISGRPLTRREDAEHFVAALLAHPQVVVVEPGARHWTVLRELSDAANVRGDLYPDAHLAALAIANGAEVCSTDSDFARFPRLKWTDPTQH